MAQENKPCHEIWMDNIRATIWANESSTGETWYSVTTSRIYRDDSGQRHESKSYSFRDLPSLERAVNATFIWIEQKLEPESQAKQIGAELVETLVNNGKIIRRRAS